MADDVQALIARIAKERDICVMWQERGADFCTPDAVRMTFSLAEASALADALAAATERADRQGAALARVRALHQPTREDGVLCGDIDCEDCQERDGHNDVEVCAHCRDESADCDGMAVFVYWPCPTARAAALDGEQP